MRRDLDFLRGVATMDYSLLVGVHYPAREAAGAATDSSADEARGAEFVPFGFRQRPPWVDHVDGAILSNGAASIERAVYFIGVIDILTAWSAAKRTESVAKQAVHPVKRKGVSCMPPSVYSRRFHMALQRWIA